jgi:hypothetical protein
LSRIIAAAAAVLSVFAFSVESAGADVTLTHAADPSAVATGFAGNPFCYGFQSSSILQTFDPAAFGLVGPLRLTDLRLPWSGGLFAVVTATNPGGDYVTTSTLGSYSSTDYSAVQGVYGGLGTLLVPGGSQLQVRTLLNNAPGFFPPPVFGLNYAPSDGVTSWYSDCQTPLEPLSNITSGTLPLSLTAVPLSRADLSNEVQALVPTLNQITPGDVNSLAQQALNGNLNDFLNHIEAKNKSNGSSIYDYLSRYAELLLGTSTVGYPCCEELPVNW